MPSEIKPCTCPNTTQDKFHGRGNRVFNQCKDGWRCTSCLRVVKENATPKKGK